MLGLAMPDDAALIPRIAGRAGHKGPLTVDMGAAPLYFCAIGLLISIVSRQAAPPGRGILVGGRRPLGTIREQVLIGWCLQSFRRPPGPAASLLFSRHVRRSSFDSVSQPTHGLPAQRSSERW